MGGEQLNSVGSGGGAETANICALQRKHVGATLSHVSGSRVWQSFHFEVELRQTWIKEQSVKA